MERRPIVLIDGKLSELPTGDTLPGGGSDFNFSFHVVDIAVEIKTNQTMFVRRLEILDGTLTVSGILEFF